MREWLKTIREQLNLTQAQAGQAAGISRQYYAFIEAGERGNPLNVATAKKIASALGFEWIRFYEHDDAPGVGDTEQPA